MPPSPNRVHFPEDEMLENVPEDIIRAAERADSFLIESDAMALIWLRGRCVLSITRKDDSTQGFRQRVDAIFERLSGELDETSPKPPPAGGV